MSERKERTGSGARWGATSVVAPAAATLVVVACTLFLHLQATAAPPDPSDFMETAAERRPFLALIVAQPADCGEATTHLEMLNAPEVRRVVRTGGLVIGGRAELAGAQAALEERFGAVAVLRATRRHLAALETLGVRATPSLLLLDRTGAVILSTPVPRERAAADRLRRLLAVVAGDANTSKEGTDGATG